MRKRGILCAVGSCIMLLALGTMAGAQSWESFHNATFSGIYCNRDGNSYTLTLGKNACYSVDEGTSWIDVSEIQGFFILSKNEGDTFTATNSDNNKPWKWVEHGNQDPDNIAGWTGNSKDARLVSSNPSKTFTFGSLEMGDVTPVIGIHIGDDAKTGYYKGTLASVPEPTSILAACSILGPAGFVFRRKKKQL